MIEDIDSFQKIEALEKTVKALQDQLAASSQEPASFNLFGGKQNYEVSSEDIGDSNETVDLVPKVNLHYPDDYVQVRKLPSHKMKRVARKRVRSWARQTLGCLMTTLLCYSAGDDRAKHRPGEVVGRTKHMAYVSTWRRRRTGCPLGTFLWSCPIDP